MKHHIVYVFILFAFLSCKTKQPATSSYVPPKTNTSAQTSADDKDFQYVFFNANKEKLLGNYSLAATLFQQCVKMNPGTAAPYYELANIYNYNKEKDKALEYSKKAATIDPKNVWYQLLYSDCLLAKKNYNEAAVVYQNVLKIYPEKIDMYFDLADIYLQANKPVEAIKIYDKIEERIGINDEGGVQKVRVYRSMKNTDKALKELDKLMKYYPKEGKYYGMLGEVYEAAGQKEKALQAYNDLLKLDPENPYAYLSLGEYYYNDKQPAKALEQYTVAIKNKRLDIDTKVKILLNYYDLSGMKPEYKSDAMVLCKALAETHPDEAKAYTIYADFLFRDKKLAEARDQYRKANGYDKSKYVIWDKILFIDSDLSDFASMLKDSKETVELFPTQPLGYLFNAIANLQNKNYTDAISSLKEGKEYVVEDNTLATQFYSTLGDAYYQSKNYAESDAAYDKALDIDPKNVYVLNNYAYYLSLRNEKMEKAEAMSKKTNELVPNNDSYLDTYGWILYQTKKYQDAKTWIGKALDNGGKNNSVILEHYGDILYKLDEKDKAFDYWQDAKKKGTGSEFLDKKISDKKLYE